MNARAKQSGPATDLLDATAGKQFKTILADPPWRFQNKTGKVAPEHRRLSRYATLTLEEICSLPLAGIAAPTAHLYLWCPNALLPDGLAVMAAWDFTYKANIVWHKVRKDGGSDGRGVGFYFRNVTEVILFGTRGKNARTLAPGRTQVNYLATRKREHSRKPDEQYPLIESCSPGPYLELFGRGVRPGWMTWGDQADDSYEPAWETYSRNSATERAKSVVAERRIYDTMTKTVRVFETGEPEVMRIDDIEPPSPKRGEVHIRHHAIGVNFIDTYFRSGAYPVSSLPFTPGNEGAGEIIGLGEGVTDFKLGDRVAYVTSLGAYAGERVIATDRLVKLPKSISYEAAAAIMLKGLTVQYLLRRTFKVKAGDTILVHAAAGGVGLILCQWAKALGATVIGTVGSPEKAKLAKKAGAKHTILYREEDFAARVKAITKGSLCDVVYDGVGKATFPASLDCIRPLGLFVSFGSASGQIEAFNLGLLSTKGSLFATRPSLHTYSAKREDLEKMARELFRIVASGAVKVPLHQTRPLDDMVNVHRALEGRETTGATVLVP